MQAKPSVNRYILMRVKLRAEKAGLSAISWESGWYWKGWMKNKGDWIQSKHLSLIDIVR